MLLAVSFSCTILFYFSAISAYADDIRDIKPPVYFKANHLFLIILLTVLILAILVLLIKFLLEKIKKSKEDSLHVLKSPHQVAYEALQALKDKNLPAQGRIKDYYFELSVIARRYIENRFSIRAPEMTTEEFLFALRNSGILTGEHKNLVKEFLNLCDIVKFAKYGPTQREIEESFNAAKRLVDETKMVEEEQGKVDDK